YISRNDDELSKLKSSKINGAVRSKTAKEDLIEALKLKEQREYIEGFAGAYPATASIGGSQKTSETRILI
ncbi:13355_t:CDS:2, partial [Racocetra fulgida]